MSLAVLMPLLLSGISTKCFMFYGFECEQESPKIFFFVLFLAARSKGVASDKSLKLCRDNTSVRLCIVSCC